MQKKKYDKLYMVSFQFDISQHKWHTQWCNLSIAVPVALKFVNNAIK